LAGGGILDQNFGRDKILEKNVFFSFLFFASAQGVPTIHMVSCGEYNSVFSSKNLKVFLVKFSLKKNPPRIFGLLKKKKLLFFFKYSNISSGEDAVTFRYFAILSHALLFV